MQVRGWVYRTRSSGKIVFAVLRDSTGIVQVTIKKGNLPDPEFEQAVGATIESSVEVRGTVHKDDRAPGGYELRAKGFRLIGPAPPFPITEYQSEELLLDNRHLWIRSREQTAVMKVKASLLMGARNWLDENGFFEVTPPIFTQNACEGGVTLFKLKYFDREAYLSQSAQMYLEAIMFSLERVYSLTPSFRAEKSRTTRHLTEFWHLELEEAWVDNIGNMKIQEELVSAMVQEVVRDRKEEISLLGRDIEQLKAIVPPFKRVTYSHMIERLQGKGIDIAWGCDLGAAEERAVTQEEIIPDLRHQLPHGVQGLLHEAGPGRPPHREVRRPVGTRGIWRDNRRKRARNGHKHHHGPLGGATGAGRRLPMVSGPASLWFGAAFRFRVGGGAGIALGVQIGAHPGRGAFPAHRGQGLSLSHLLGKLHVQ